ncbi:MAG: leucine-rich repeat domain-containing protein [Phycisphaerae bacterium]|nr:leucine-rich repeat domain-containing protein [Phycisphaerae bacterium]
MIKAVYIFFIFSYLFIVADGIAAGSDPVYFPDANLKSIIEIRLGIDDPTEDDMGMLTSLNADFRNISDLTGIGYASNLTELSVRYNQLASVPAELGNLTSLTRLSLMYNALSSIPAEIGNLTALTGLYLDNNQLSTLPAEIGNLTNLTWLGLKSNELSALPEEIGALTSLTGLYLLNNELETLPDAFGQLVNLNWLDLGNNQLVALPKAFGDLVSLAELSLYGNKLNSLPEEFGNLNALTSFYINGNQLNSIFYCFQIAVIQEANPGLTVFSYDANANVLTADCYGDLADFAVVSANFARDDCSQDNNFCDGADMSGDGKVDLEDLMILAGLWLRQ